MANAVLASGDYERGFALLDERRVLRSTGGPATARKGRPSREQQMEKLYGEIRAKSALMWSQPLLVWRGLALTNIWAAAAVDLGPDLAYPVVRHVIEGISSELGLRRPGGSDDLPEMIEIARLTDDGATLHHAASEVAHKRATNARDRYAMQERLRKAFPKHEGLYRIIGASDDIEVLIDTMILQLERWSIQQQDFVVVAQDFARRHG